MTHVVAQRITDMADQLAARAEEAEELGRVPDASAKLLRESGIMRMLQPQDYGGFEAHPCDFVEAVMAAAASGCAATGWVAGVLGLHPWEVAVMDRRAQEEVWADDPDAWIGSPYVAQGRAKRVDGGYILDGRWNFSSGVDHTTWIHLGGLIEDDEGNVTPGTDVHFLLPRTDYEPVEGSWDTAGLRGTGSKDVVVRHAFVPEYRVLHFHTVVDGSAARSVGREDVSLYKMPWFTLFGNAVSASVVGIAESVLVATLAYQRSRVNVFGTEITADPYVLPGIAEAASEIAASRLQILANVKDVFDTIDAGGEPTMHQRAQARRDQIRASWRAAQAADQLFAACGGNALRRERPVQRLWRDVHAGVNHAVNIPGPSYQTAALSLMGIEPPLGSLI